MYRAARDFDVAVPPEAFLDLVWDFASYPEFVKGVREVEVVEPPRAHAGRLETTIRVTAGVAGMAFCYVLACERDARSVSWRRVSGAFRDAEGSVVHLGLSRFRYENALDPGFAVPEFAVRFVLERSLPRLIRDLRERAEQLARRGKPTPPS